MRRTFAILALVSACVGYADASRAGESALVSPPHMSAAGLAAKWREAQQAMSDDEARLAACRAESWMCSDDEARFEAIVGLGRARQGRARIGEVNRAVNLAIRAVSDERRFGVADRWASPLETIGAAAGDCEDYAILKLLALHDIGIARDDLRLMIVQDRASRADHAVAAVRLDGRWLLLDNRSFALVDLASTPYRVLVALGPDKDATRYARLGLPGDVDATFDVM
jgi:predicted transglutaminase-like cysteine proteinase